MNDTQLIIICFSVIGVGLVVILSIVYHDEQQGAENLVSGVGCDWLKRVIIDQEEGKIIQSAVYHKGVLEYDSRCLTVQEDGQ